MIENIPAWHFDGRSSRKHHVLLMIDAETLRLSGGFNNEYAWDQIHVYEQIRNASGKLGLPDGGYVEIPNADAFLNLLTHAGHRSSWISRMQHSAYGNAFAVVLIVTILLLGYFYGLPTASAVIARALPLSVDHTIGEQTLSLLDSRILRASELPTAQRMALAERFETLTLPPPDSHQAASERFAYRIIFRKSEIGPNAFALPSGEIVVTDEIVKLMDNDDAMMAILAHELGHLQHRHFMRRVIQSSVIGGIVTLLFGDVSALAANASTLMLDMRYSRDAEREADQYAVALLKVNGIALSHMIDVFENLAEYQKGKKMSEGGSYLSSHPGLAERIENVRQAK